MSKTLQAARRMLGIIEQEEVLSVDVTREQFMELFEEAITASRFDEHQQKFLRDELTPVAMTMERFPLGTWLHHTRGCGCVVGEYLVATREIDMFNTTVNMAQACTVDRRKAIHRAMRDSSVEELLSRNPHGETLADFGQRIDDVVSDWLGDQSILDAEGDEVGWRIRTVEIVDEEVAA